MRKIIRDKSIFLVIVVTFALSIMSTPNGACAEDDIAAYGALAEEYQHELKRLKAELLGAEKDTGKDGDGESAIDRADVLETVILEQKQEIGALEQKIIQLIIFEQDEGDRKALKKKLMELRELKRELEEEEAISQRNLRIKVSEQRRENLLGRRWDEQASLIEKAYAEDLSLRIPRRLEQFGYDIFEKTKVKLEEGEREEALSERKEDRITELTELLMVDKLLGNLGDARGKSSFGQSMLGERAKLSPEVAAATRAVGPDYIVGPGDVLRLRMWGAIDTVSDLEVDEEGKIVLPKKGPVHVWGMRLDEVKKIINKYIRESYSNVESEVTMGRIKTIQVFVLGDVEAPGAHLLTPYNTVFNALYAAQGPTKAGTLRSVKLVRKKDEKINVDLYNLLLRGEQREDMKLQAGDVVFVPPIGHVVGVAGNVNRPAIYEMKAPLKVSEVIQMSGGLTPMGYGKRLQIERVERHTKKVVVDLKFDEFSELESSTSNIELQNGDLVLVFPIIADKENAVKIIGAVRMPGTYELKEGMAVRDLIESAEGLKRGAYLRRGEVARFNNGVAEELLVFDIRALMEGDETQNIKLKEFDEVMIYEENQVLTRGKAQIDGAVYKPGTYPLSKNMKISDLLFSAGGVKPSASLNNAELFKVVWGQAPQVINVDLKPIIDNGKGAHDLLLQDGDHLFVREAVEWVEKRTITLSGEFKYPGVYAVRKGEALSSVIERAGGFSDEAFLQGALFTRESVKEAEKQARSRFVRMQKKRLLEEEASLSGRLVYSEAQREATRKSLKHRKELLEHLAETETPGRLLVNLAPQGGFKGTKYDMLIEDGDNLYVPQYPSSVQVLGGVYKPSSITYQPGRGVEYYLDKIGGLSENADKNRIYIVKANGEARSRFTRAMIVGRGDTIVVPEAFRYVIPPGVIFKDVITTLSQAFTTVAVVDAITD